MPELHLLTGAYALDALDDIERMGFERHLRDCDTCVTEVHEFHEAAAFMAARVATPAPELMRARVLAEVARTRQGNPAVRRSLPRLSFRRMVAVAASAVLLAGAAGLGGIAWQGHRAAHDAQVQAAGIASVMNDPGRIQASDQPTGGGAATVVAASGRAVFAADELPALAKGKAYQLWLIPPRATEATSEGLLELQNGSGQVLVDGVQHGATIAVSVEPSSGSKQPTTVPVLKLAV